MAGLTQLDRVLPVTVLSPSDGDRGRCRFESGALPHYTSLGVHALGNAFVEVHPTDTRSVT